MGVRWGPEGWRWIGNGMIVAGVLVWAPFLAALAAGEDWPIFPFLAAHLTGVLGGWHLRRRAMAMEHPTEIGWEVGRRRRWLSRLLI
ncbi:MAG: hypothetical protein ACK4OK_07815 [Thermoflexus sp.]